jgi:hypothetical protein
MDNTELIGHAWLSYREKVLGKDANEIQLTECRRAFYAGAWGLFTTVLAIMEPGPEATEGDVATMEGIEGELQRFVAAVAAGSA